VSLVDTRSALQQLQVMAVAILDEAREAITGLEGGHIRDGMGASAVLW
jgi:hypothetical protein